MSGNLGLGEPFEPTSVLNEVTLAARIFDKNTWDDVTEDVAHAVAVTAEGQTAKMKVRVLAQHGPGACDIEARTMTRAALTGQVVRIQLFVEGELVADYGFNQYVGEAHRLAVQMRVIAIPDTEANGALP